MEIYNSKLNLYDTFVGDKLQALTHPDNNPFWHISTDQIILALCVSVHSNNKQEISVKWRKYQYTSG